MLKILFYHQVDMRAMREVNINWKMLTNLRPDNKADEIFFAQWESDKLNIFLLLVYVVVILRIRLRTGYYRLVDLERLKRSTRREEEEARVSRNRNRQGPRLTLKESLPSTSGSGNLTRTELSIGFLSCSSPWICYEVQRLKWGAIQVGWVEQW